MTRFRHWPVGFQPLLSDSGDRGRNPVVMARFQPILPKSGLAKFQQKFSNSYTRQIPAIGYQNLGTFDDRFGLLINSNTWRWWVSTNVCAIMKSLNSKNDLWFCFSKIKKAFTINWKWFPLIIIFEWHQTPEKYFSKKYFMPKQTEHHY